MRKLLLSALFGIAFSVASAQDDHVIRFDNGTPNHDFLSVFKTAVLNQVVAISDGKGQPLMLIMLPANGGHSPVPGTYPIVDGSKRTVKKGSGVAKLEFAPGGYVSAENGGTLTITENDSIFTFSADNVDVVNAKTKETHKLSFKVAMFIEKR